MSESRRVLLSIAACLAMALLLAGLWGVADGMRAERWSEIVFSVVLVLVAGWAARHFEREAMPEFLEKDAH